MLHPPVNTPGRHPSSSRSESHTNLPFYFVLFPVCFFFYLSDALCLFGAGVAMVTKTLWMSGGFCWILIDSHMHKHTRTHTSGIAASLHGLLLLARQTVEWQLWAFVTDVLMHPRAQSLSMNRLMFRSDAYANLSQRRRFLSSHIYLL